jgi:aminopeptidase-like protein
MDQESETAWLSERFDELWPITRSITGPGLRESLEILQQDIPLEIEGVPSGTEVFDWEIPPEWRIREAQLTGPDGTVYAAYEDTNLAVVNYSEPVDETLPLAELQSHLHSDPDVPEAIPYVTSYYDRNWGFCLPHNVRSELPDGEYHAHIDSEFVDGELNFGQTVLPGESDKEILLSTYLCHPSLATAKTTTGRTTQFKRRLAKIPPTSHALCWISR